MKRETKKKGGDNNSHALNREDIIALENVFTLARRAVVDNERTLADLINFKSDLFKKLENVIESKN